MQDKVFPVQKKWQVRRLMVVLIGIVTMVSSSYSALQQSGFWWGITALAGGMVIYSLLGLTRQRWVVRLGASGVDICLATGRKMHADWSAIHSHAISPGHKLGALMISSGTGGKAQLLPISTGLIGTEASEELIAALKERLPKLEYRVPKMGAGRK
jgi:hypothetical protein